MSERSDGGSDADGLESTPLCVGDDTSKDGDNVGEELERLRDGGCFLQSESERSGRLGQTGLALGDSSSSVSSLQRNTCKQDRPTSVNSQVGRRKDQTKRTLGRGPRTKFENTSLHP